MPPVGQVILFKKSDREREQRKLDPKRQDLVRRIVAGHPETKWGRRSCRNCTTNWRRGGSRTAVIAGDGFTTNKKAQR